MLKYLSNFKDKNIYKVNLFIIKKENEDEAVKSILVEKTASDNYVREILTGMFIPVNKTYIKDKEKMIKLPMYRIKNLNRNFNDNSMYVRKLENLSTKESYYSYGLFTCPYFYLEEQIIATKEEIEIYKERYKDIWILIKEIGELYEESKRRYNNLCNKEIKSINKKVRVLKKHISY